ncbi:MAG TPA: glucokinase [Pseudolabrys sp.]|nr:glucokinase [Pseudolabrys sp.]
MNASTPNDHRRFVLADVGGTHVRFAVRGGGRLGNIGHMDVRDYAQFADALAAFLSEQEQHPPIRGAILAVAGAIEGERCELTNSGWVVDAVELRARFGFQTIRIINDFEAIAWALPHLPADAIRKLGGGDAQPQAPMAVLGPGTGLGVAAYVPLQTGGIVLRSEGGHSTLAAGSAREDAIIDRLRQRFGHVSVERALSGPGLENLYHAIAALDGVSVPERSAAEISQAGIAGSCATSRAALDTFCALLGDVAGNFALAYAAQGGVFVGGGVTYHLHDYLPQSQFRARFEAKGRMAQFVAAIPVYLIVQHDMAFIGLSALAAMHD